MAYSPRNSLLTSAQDGAWWALGGERIYGVLKMGPRFTCLSLFENAFR